MPYRFPFRLALSAVLAALVLVPTVALADDEPVDVDPIVLTGDDPASEDPGVFDDSGVFDDEWLDADDADLFADDIPPLALVQAGKRFGIALGFDLDDETLVPEIVLLREVSKNRCVVAGKKPRKGDHKGKPCDALAARTRATVVKEWDVEVDGLPTVLLHHERTGAYRVYVTAQDVDGSEHTLAERFVAKR